MAFEDKQPSVRVMMTIDEYNKLITLLSNSSDIDVEKIREKANDIKDKALRYTQPLEDNKVVARFFPSQIENIVLILLSKAKEVSISENYYKVLVENRENYKKQKENN